MPSSSNTITGTKGSCESSSRGWEADLGTDLHIDIHLFVQFVEEALLSSEGSYSDYAV